ncbi:MAG: hypothetical protein A2X28_09080 [Elusimicrobia bacterium GWA2_56_46]|nr:MAG: hypothetical protein A2X28_09080 [Elusimicrobia bacterium GWA2_56_46]OGR54456.1 MAG: hypothetical protein A2X39_04160 [Elusimicrobia bacterium GWC2_56_31]HBB66834.1 hypothetical protein [Elusimicrobiota bacterium]HBW22564.1 hypothetical protein [Elusimicrobiota bacterium]
MILFILLFSVLNLSAAGPPEAPPAAWHLKASPHFKIYHESDWSPDSISLELERLYGRLRFTVSMFAPWMVSEKTRIYIYRDQDSYLKGEFNPPKWSKGLAYFATKTVVVYDPGDIVKLRAVAAHELSHLYFESYYGEYLAYPPQWLNEGLAVLMEDMSYPGEGPWTQALKYFPAEKILPLDGFLKLSVDRLDSAEEVGYWYLEAFGVVSYLFQPRKRLQFKNLCQLLRKGEKLEPALWKMYRIKNFPDFDRSWRDWLRVYEAGGKQSFAGDFSSAGFNFKPAQLSSFTFTNFRR